MNNLCDEVIQHVCTYLTVAETLHVEFAIRRRGATALRSLIERYKREPKHKEVTIFKKGRYVNYKLDSYYDEGRLYTKVTSVYGRHKIISVVSHRVCKSTSEANIWALNAFTYHKTSIEQIRNIRSRDPMLLQLHVQ